ncbi:MAG: AglZ/HisF2 family acetamidino modification protein [Melioribacteraceae bacterium]|nr:AglZ/HisF2 family acetamidino modification protein [Melioribacteraceae bacterium]
MLRHRVIPTLLLKNNGLVKTTKFKNPVYIGDPINAVKIFNDKEVDELILLDITATNDKREPNYKKIEEIVSEAFMPIGYGGGINNLSQIERLFKLGIEKVIINSAAFYNYNLISKSAEIYGNQSIVLAVDIKKDFFGKYRLYSNSGKEKKKILIKDHIIKCVNNGCGEVYLNNIDRDGTMLGYDLELIDYYSRITDVPIIVSGGAGKVVHFAEAIKAGADSVSAGAMFVFQGIYRAVLISYPKYKELEHLLN